MVVFVGCAVLGLVSHPEIMVKAFFLLVTCIPSYVEWAGKRIVNQSTVEMNRLFGWAPSFTPQQSSSFIGPLAFQQQSGTLENFGNHTLLVELIKSMSLEIASLKANVVPAPQPSSEIVLPALFGSMLTALMAMFARRLGC